MLKKTLLTLACLPACLAASTAALTTPVYALGSPTPVMSEPRPGECHPNDLPVMRMDGSWTNPNRYCNGTMDKVQQPTTKIHRHHHRRKYA
jgi:hypothetical protein